MSNPKSKHRKFTIGYFDTMEGKKLETTYIKTQESSNNLCELNAS